MMARWEKGMVWGLVMMVGIMLVVRMVDGEGRIYGKQMNPSQRKILDRILARQEQRPARRLDEAPVCDPTLSWYQVTNYLPGYDFHVTIFMYQQLDCATYNNTIWFSAHWPQPMSLWQFQGSRLIAGIRAPPNPDYPNGVDWDEGI